MIRAEIKKVRIYQKVILTSVLRRNLALVFEDISNPFYGMEKFGFKVFVNLASEVRYMNINHIGGRIKMIIENLFRYHRPGNDLTWMSHEKLEESIFCGREFDLYPVPRNPMPIRFQNKIGDLQS